MRGKAQSGSLEWSFWPRIGRGSGKRMGITCGAIRGSRSGTGGRRGPPNFALGSACPGGLFYRRGAVFHAVARDVFRAWRSGFGVDGGLDFVEHRYRRETAGVESVGLEG